MIPRLGHGTWEPLLRIAFLLLIFGVLARFDRIASEASLYLRRALSDGVDYQAIRMQDPLYASALEARRIIPEDAPWNVSHQGDLWAFNRAMYTLYPNFRLEKNWKFFIDMTGEIKQPDPAWLKHPLSTGAIVYARDGAAFLDPPRAPIPSYSNIPTLATFAGITIAQLLFGLACLAALRMPIGAAGALWHLGSAYPLGFIALHTLSWLMLLAGIPFHIGTIAPAWTILVVAALFAARQQILATLSEFRRAERWRAILPDTAWGWLTMAVVLLVLAALLLPIVLVPAWSFDVLGHWFYKAKGIVHHGSLAYLAEVNTQEYPLTWTLQAATLFLFSGGARDEAMQWTNALMIIVLLIQLHGTLLFLRVSRAWAWVALLLFLTFFYQANLSWSYADTPFLTYLAALFAALAALSTGSRGALVLAAGMATGLSLIKLEGGVAAVLVAGAFAAVQPGFPKSRKAWLTFCVLAAPALLGLAWKAYVAHLGYGGETHMKEPFSLDRLQLLIARVVNSIDGQGMGWRLFCGAAIILLLRPGRRWTRFEMFLGLAGLPLVLFAALGLIGWSTTDIDKNTLTATDRLVLHATPALLLLLGSLLAAPPDTEAAEEATP